MSRLEWVLAGCFLSNLIVVALKVVENTPNMSSSERLFIPYLKIWIPIRAVGAFCLMIYSFVRKGQAIAGRLISVFALMSYNLATLLLHFGRHLKTFYLQVTLFFLSEIGVLKEMKENNYKFYLLSGLVFILLSSFFAAARAVYFKYISPPSQDQSSTEPNKSSGAKG